jgi:NADH dehydrogenase
VEAFAVAAIGHPAAMNQHLPLGGPDAVSWRDVIAVCEGALGRSINVESLPPGSPIPGLPEPLGQMVGEMMTSLEMFDSVIDITDTARAFGVRQTSVEEALRRLFAGGSQI